MFHVEHPTALLWRVDESIWFHVKHPTARSSPDRALGFDGKPAQIQTSGSALNNPTDLEDEIRHLCAVLGSEQ